MPDPTLQAKLRAIKLTALARDHGVAVDSAAPGEFPGGAAFTIGDQAWVLAEEQGDRVLGPALAWALRHGAAALHLVVAADAHAVARRASAFAMDVSVWRADGRALTAMPVQPLPVPPDVPPHHLALRPDIEAAGATPAIEHGVLVGEVAGLEVCRVVDDPHTGATRLEVGVGAHDREAFQLVHGDRPTVDALRDVVTAVAAHRRPGAEPHPLNRLAPERALRDRLVHDPAIIGAEWVEAVPPPLARTSLKDVTPCVAVASIDGRTHTIVCTHGVDLDVVPYAVDARAATGFAATIVVMPARDLLPVQQLLADAVAHPVRLMAVAGA